MNEFQYFIEWPKAFLAEAVPEPPVLKTQPDIPKKLSSPSADIDPKRVEKIRRFGNIEGGTLYPHKSLAVPRANMPQLKDREEFIQWLLMQGIVVKRVVKSAKELVWSAGQSSMAHAQQTMTLEKAQKFVRKQNILGKKIILTLDNIIFDGNHHWLALMLTCPKCPVEMYQVHMPFRELLELSKQFPGVTYEEWYA